MTFAACYAIIAGLAMMGQWTLSIVRRQVPELATEPIRIGFHLAGEWATAILLVIGGSAVLADAGWGVEVALVSMGMLLYTVIVSPGYFGQKGRWPMVGMFAVLLVLTLASCGLLIAAG
jgi:hypothetical protein